MDKKLQLVLFIFLCLVVLSISSAQIPNAGFENWTAGQPDSWSTDNVPPVITPVTQTSDANSGTSAVQGAVVTYLTVSYPPVLWADFPISARYGSLRGYYKFSPVSGDTLDILVVLFKNGSPIASGFFNASASVSDYTQFAAPITYGPTDVPDSAWIEIIIVSSDNVHVGSTFKIDDLSFDPITSVPELVSTNPAAFKLSQNYPNPFNPTTMISYQIPTTGMVRLEVCDILGRTLATLVNEEKSAGQYSVTFNGSNFTSGVYFYRINLITGDSKLFSQSNKMILTK